MARREPRDPDVPRLPRGRGFKLSFPELLRIGLTATMLIAVIVLARPCGDAVGHFVANFDPPDAQPPPAPKVVIPSNAVRLTPDMTPQQIEQAIQGARDAGVSDAPAPAPDSGLRAPGP